MKLGVIIAVSKYSGSGLSDLPGCVQDAKLIQTILEAQDGYEEILSLTIKTTSVEIKQHLIDFVNRHKGKTIAELFFYYTGHGVFLNNEYYYLFSDYQQQKLRQTALENTELDNLIRTLNPTLATKMVDSCQSGLPYIKDSGEIDMYLKGTQSGFQNCYFLFSSHTDELSYQDNVISAFTRAVGELIASRTGVIRHKDIIDYVSDSFSLNNLQTPFFVVQADFTDQFCKVDSALQKKVASLLSTIVEPSGTSILTETAEATLKAFVEKDALLYCTQEEAFAALKQLTSRISDYDTDPEGGDLYTMEVNELSDYSIIPNMIAIGKWFKETKHNFFAEPTYERIRVRRTRASSLLKKITGEPMIDSDYESIFETRVKGVRSTTEMPYVGILVRARPKYPNLVSTGCFLVPFVSRTHIILFVGTVSFIVRGWEEETLTGDVKWRTLEAPLKEEEDIATIISTVMKEFWDFTLVPIKKKYGLLKEVPELDSGKRDSDKEEDAGDQK